MDGYHIFPLGDQAITLSLGNTISPATHQKIMAMKQWIEQHPFNGMLDIVVAYSSLTIIYDLYLVKKYSASTSAFQFVKERLIRAFEESLYLAKDTTEVIRVPVCYEEPFAPDLEYVSLLKKISREEIIELHTTATYLVYMIAFLPGFPYMASVHEKLLVPRKEKLRARVEAGSVGIAGVQTGIYPVVSPGGWQIIGRTPVRMFDKNDNLPVKLEPGNKVQFYAIPKEEFENYNPASV